jgi:regulator of protease activity HflC (stomatin/prohibitin superfamily)
MRSLVFTALAATFALTGCAGRSAVVDPGHLGIIFDPMHGVRHDPVGPGYYRLSKSCREMQCPRIDDFDITFSTKKEDISTTSLEGLGLQMHLAIIYRPVATELYELDTEVGQTYYDEVVGPEFRSAARGVLARHSYQELMSKNQQIEDEIEVEVRNRIKGKHVEVSSITMERIDYAPEIAQAVRSKLVGEQEALRQKAQIENEALKKKLEIEHAAEEAKLRGEQQLRAKEQEKQLATAQVSIDKLVAESESAARIVRAKASAEEMRLLAKGEMEKNRAEQTSLTPLMVQMHAYDALGKLGGNGTTIMLGDFAHVPSFLFPRSGAFANAYPASVENPTPEAVPAKSAPPPAPSHAAVPMKAAVPPAPAPAAGEKLGEPI